jgi:hypothetical protein
MRIYQDQDGVKYASVTTVLKYTETDEQIILNNLWRTYVPDCKQNVVLQEASDRGVYVHSQIENFYKTGVELDLLSIGITKERAKKLENELSEYKCLETEYFLFDESLKVAGTADAILSKDGTCFLVDWKTSKRSYSQSDADKKLLQLSAYVTLANNQGFDIQGAIIGNLNVTLKTRGFNWFYFDMPAITEAYKEFQERLLIFKEEYGSYLDD